MSSQIAYDICLVDTPSEANIIHWSLIKCKQVTRSVLAIELYGIVHRFDFEAVIKATLEKILESAVPLILCTDSKSFYDCPVKLGITQEKRLIVDVMSLCQSYERREITKLKWIHRHHNPADSMTKARPLLALKMLIDSNRINISTTEWVERASMKQASTSI